MKLAVALLAVSAAALVPPPAHAQHAQARCAGVIASTPVSGQNQEAVVYGYVVGAATEIVGVRCYVSVDGSDVGGTTYVPGVGAAATAGRVSWAGAALLCVEYGHSHGFESYCRTFSPL